MLYSDVEAKTLYYLLQIDDDTTSTVLPTRRGGHEKTHGMRDRRRNVYVSLEVWMLWLGFLASITIVHGACDRPRLYVKSTRGYTRPIHLTFAESSSSLPNRLSSLTSSISSTADLAASVLSLLLSKKLWTSSKRIWVPNPFVVLLRKAQTDLAIRIWTILVPIRSKKPEKNGFGPFSYTVSFSYA